MCWSRDRDQAVTVFTQDSFLGKKVNIRSFGLLWIVGAHIISPVSIQCNQNNIYRFFLFFPVALYKRETQHEEKDCFEPGLAGHLM